MNDSDWRDPFAEDEAAREREARRAERAARRREREQQTRESLGERVREELAGERPKEPAELPPPAEPRAAAPPPAPPAAAPPARRPLTSSQVRHRRTVGLIALGVVIALLAGAGVVISRGGDDGTAPPAEAPRKTTEVTIPEGYDRSQIATVAKKAGLKGNYEKASRSSNQINLKKYGANGAESLEGFLFPATYELFRDAEVDALVEKQLEAFESNLAGIDLSAARE